MRAAGRAVMLLLAAGLAAGAAGAAEEGAEAGQPTLDEVVAAVRAREARVKSFVCSWEADYYRPKSIDVSVTGEVQEGQATTSPESTRLTVDGSKAHFTLSGDVYNVRLGSMREYTLTGVLVEGEARRLDDRGNGFIEDYPRVMGLAAAKPVRLAYRLFDPELGDARPDVVLPPGEDPGKALRLVEWTEEQGHPCVVLEQLSENGLSLSRWWLARDMDYAPVRWEGASTTGGMTVAGAIGYERSEEGLWLPSAWRVRLLGPDGTVHVAWDVKEATVRLNEPVDPALFDLEFPPGTHVTDEDTHTEWVVGEEDPPPQPRLQPAVLEAPAEPERSRAQERPTPPPPPVAAAPREPAAQRSAAPPWVLLGLAGLLAAVALAVVIARRRRMA